MLWNGLGLVSLLNIVANAVLSVPSPVQQFGFDQPNVAILHFPFVRLPHLAALRQLWAANPANDRLGMAAETSVGAALP